MATFKHYSLLSLVAQRRFSANAQDTQHTIGPDGTTVYAGAPEFGWKQFVVIKDAGIIWTHGKAHHFNATGAEIEQLTERLNAALLQVTRAEAAASEAARQSADATTRAETAERAATEAQAAAQAVKEALDRLHIEGDTEAIVAQVLTNTADIAALKERIDNLRPGTGSDTNVSIEFDEDEGDLILTTGSDSRVMGGELTDDGDLILDLDII